MAVLVPRLAILLSVLVAIASCFLFLSASRGDHTAETKDLGTTPRTFLDKFASAETSQDADNDDIGSDLFPQVLGNLSSDIEFDDDDVGVIISGCKGLKFTPLQYKAPNFAKDFFHLSQPHLLSADYMVSPQPACKNGLGPVGYGREHIYEVQLVAMFIDKIMNDHPNIWQYYPTETKCTYIGKRILKHPTGTPLIRSLLECLPYNVQPHQKPYMPWLDSLANGIKASAFNGHALRQEKTFKGDPPTKKVMTMRAVAGLLSYMNHKDVSESFIQQSACMREKWVKWLDDYRNIDPMLDPMTIVGQPMDTYYTDWIKRKVEEFENNLMNGLNRMEGWWVEQYDQANPPQSTQTVAYDYRCNYNSKYTGGHLVTRNDVIPPLRTFMAQNSLTWRNQL